MQVNCNRDIGAYTRPPMEELKVSRPSQSSTDAKKSSGICNIDVFPPYLLRKPCLNISKFLVFLLDLHQHRRLHIRQANGNSLHLTASSRSNFSAVASRQNAEIFKQRLLFSRSSAWWSCWASSSG